jgi:hypothetical protein
MDPPAALAADSSASASSTRPHRFLRARHPDYIHPAARNWQEAGSAKAAASFAGGLPQSTQDKRIGLTNSTKAFRCHS